VAEDRTAALEELSRRPLVRLVVGVERRARPPLRRASAAAGRARTGAARASLAARAALVARGADARLRDLEADLRALQPSTAPSPEVLALASPPGLAAVAEADRAIRASSAEVVVLVPAGTRLLPGTAERLAGAIDASHPAAAATVVHGARPPARATPHDGATWAAGLGVVVVDGVPVASALGAGSPVEVGGEDRTVVAALATGLALRRDAYLDAGGVAPLGALDSAAVELLVRLGGAVVVPGAIAVDERPVASAGALARPIDPTGAPWRGVIERVGPTLRRTVDPTGPASFAITIAAPSAKVAARWGDLHLAEGLAGELRAQGHGVRLQTFDRADDLAGRACDVHLVVRGLRAVRRTPGQRHVLWIISHPEAVRDDELHEADLVLVASTRLAASLGRRTDTPVRPLLQATDHRRFRPGPVDPAHAHPVTVVAKSREQLRPMVAAAVEAGLAPAIYGGGWERWVDPGFVVADHVPNEELPAVYRSAGVVLNDHWETMRADGFVSNRLFDVLACGTPVISDHLPEIEELLGDAVPTWRDSAELAALVRADLADPEAARERADRGRRTVLGAHTFEHRAAELLGHLAELGLVAAAGGPHGERP
jgi:hypothetical protein